VKHLISNYTVRLERYPHEGGDLVLIETSFQFPYSY